jgi:RNA polymerase sigma factor (sigma-70 family)
MNEDAQLLSQYAEQNSEAAFAELTRRYVDLVYSAALRLVRGNVPSAQDVTQQVFTEAARQAKRLAGHPALVGWLYTTTRLIALRANRTEQRRQAREQEAQTMNELLQDDDAPLDWGRLSPVIEDALHELNEPDRHAILLRYFQNKSLNEVGAGLGLTENAARMRVDRALDKLRGKLARHGITTTVSALAAAVSANAVQPAPAGFAAAISSAAVVGSAIQASTLIATKTTIMTTIEKAIAMTTLQKSIVAASLALAAGSGIFAAHESSQLRGKLQTLQQEQTPLTAQIQQLQQERTQASQQLAALREENARLKAGQNAAELMRLRGQVGVLRQQAAASEAKTGAPASGLAKLMSDPAMKAYIHQAQVEKIRSMYADFFKELKLAPEQSDKFLQILTDKAAQGMAKYMAPGQGAETQAPADSSSDLQSQLQALLGDAGYARFKEYSDEIPARTTVSLLNSQLGDKTLNADQSSRLLQVVKAEPANLTMGITGAPDTAFLGSQSDIDTFLQQVGESNQHIVQQASDFLTPDQLAGLNTLLNNSIETRKLQAAALIQKH